MNQIQCRMARAALGWSLAEFAETAGVSGKTVARFEHGDSVYPQSIVNMRRAFNSAGIRFVNRGRFSGAVVPPQVHLEAGAE